MNGKIGKDKYVTLKNVIVAVLVTAFFVTMLILFYRRLYEEKRGNIIANGEMAASKAADKIDKYLSTNIDAIKLTAYMLDEMIREKKTDEEIQDYLVGQSTAIRSTVLENMTGLYGYVNGRFFSGTNWEPPADYDATIRPWYLKPMSNKGNITMLDPYTDVQSGNVMLAAGKTLCDEVSVISVDISLDKIQHIVEEDVRAGETDQEMILNDKGIVVAHSNIAEAGKDYAKETGTLGAYILEELNSSDEGCFEIKHQNSHYVVYAAKLMDNWYCVSVKDATAVFGSLTVVLVLAVLTVITVVIIISAFMINANKRQLAMERLGKQLAAAADIYVSMHEINFLTDTFSEVRNNKAEASELIGVTRDHCQEKIRSVMGKFADPSSREAIMDFVDFSKLNERLKNRNTITLEWLTVDKKWRRSRYIVSDRTAKGEVARAMYLIEDIDGEKSERDKMYDTAQQLSFQIRSIANIYTSVYDFDMIRDSYSKINTTDSYVENVIGNIVGNAREAMQEAMTKLTDESSRKEVLEFVEFANIERNLAETGIATIEFLNSRQQWCRGRFIVSERTPDGKLSHVIWAVENIDEEKRRREKLTLAAETLNDRISSIANIYMTAHELDITTDTFYEIKSQLDMVNDLIGESRNHAQAALSKVMESVTDEAYIDDMRRFTDLSTLDRRMRRTDTLTMEYMNKEGLWRRGRFVVSKRDDKGKLVRVMWLSEDINNEKKERDKLRDMSERAIAASEAKTSFLSNMSHEIRTPINAVLGMNEMILRECNDKNVLVYSENIRTAGNTLLGIVNDILDFSKIEAGKMEIISADYDLTSVINDLVNMIQARADEKGLAFLLNIDREIPKFLHGDEVRIKQIIMNLLTNAVKYTEKGSVTVLMEYERIPDESEEIWLDVAVMDTGIGIKQEDMRKLFTEFDRIEEERNRKVEGTGLGLSITKHLLEMMGSKLEVESVYELGSKFYFRLKQRVTKWEELGDYETAHKDMIDARSTYREKLRAPEANILVVDDTPMNLVVFESLLKQTKVKVDTAESGDEGLALARDKKYDIIFLDHMMPDKDGIETLRELRSHVDEPNARTAVICLTANAIIGAKEEYLAAGFDDYLTKPIDPDKLENVLLAYLPKEKVIFHGEEVEERKESEVDVKDFAILAENSIDPEAGIKNSGNADSYRMLLRIFCEGVDGNVRDIDRFNQEGDLKNYTIRVHAVKSSARIIGAADLGEEAQKLENAGKEGNIEYVREHHDAFLEEYGKYKDILSKVLSEMPDCHEEDADLQEASHEFMMRVFQEIKEAAEDMDSDRLDDVFDKMKEYHVSEDLREPYEEIRQAHERYEYRRILDLLSGFDLES